MKFARMTAGVLGLLLLGAVANASAQAGFPLTSAVNGNTVSVSWSPVSGATIYGIQVQMAGGPALPPTPIGSSTSFSVPNVPNGTYTVWIWASNGAQHVQSAPATVVVGAPAAPPAAPVNLSAAISGNNVLFSWDLSDQNSLLGLLLRVGTVPGGSDLGTFPIRVSTSSFVPNVPSGTFYARLFAVGAGGESAASNELQFTTPSCTPPASIPLTTNAFGTFAQISWPQVPGALGYRLDASLTPGGAVIGSQSFGPSTTSLGLFLGIGNYYLTLHTTTSCGASAASAETLLSVTGQSGNGPRAPSGKSIGQATQELLNAVSVISSQYPNDLRNSCREFGGNNVWLFRVVQYLRLQDSRWGLNWKRANPGDMSQDVIMYNHSDLPDDQARAPQLYGWDTISGHCGPNPTGQALNITNPNGEAAWTIVPYLQAGFAP